MAEYKNTSGYTKYLVIYTDPSNPIFSVVVDRMVVTTGHTHIDVYNSEHDMEVALASMTGDADFYAKANGTYKNPDAEPPQEPTPVDEALLRYRATVTTSPWKFRMALNQLGLRSMVEAFVSSADQDVKDGWEYATSFDRLNPLIVSFGPVLGLTEEDIDSVFAVANSIKG